MEETETPVVLDMDQRESSQLLNLDGTIYARLTIQN